MPPFNRTPGCHCQAKGQDYGSKRLCARQRSLVCQLQCCASTANCFCSRWWGWCLCSYRTSTKATDRRHRKWLQETTDKQQYSRYGRWVVDTSNCGNRASKQAKGNSSRSFEDVPEPPYMRAWMCIGDRAKAWEMKVSLCPCFALMVKMYGDFSTVANVAGSGWEFCVISTARTIKQQALSVTVALLVAEVAGPCLWYCLGNGCVSSAFPFLFPFWKKKTSLFSKRYRSTCEKLF